MPNTDIAIDVAEIIKNVGLTDAILFFVIIILHIGLLLLYRSNIRGKQSEINRMAEDIKESRKDKTRMMELFYSKFYKGENNEND